MGSIDAEFQKTEKMKTTINLFGFLLQAFIKKIFYINNQRRRIYKITKFRITKKCNDYLCPLFEQNHQKTIEDKKIQLANFVS